MKVTAFRGSFMKVTAIKKFEILPYESNRY